MHYFVGFQSLCGKWGKLNNVEFEKDVSLEETTNCKGCVSKLEKRIKK